MPDMSILYGATVEKSTDAGTTWESIPKAKGVGIPKKSKDFKDVTNLDSPNGYREFIPGLKDAGEVTIACIYTPDGYADALADDESGDLVQYRATLPTMGNQTGGDVFEWSGYPTASMQDGDVEGEIMFDIMIKVSGAMAHTAGATA